MKSSIMKGVFELRRILERIYKLPHRKSIFLIQRQDATGIMGSTQTNHHRITKIGPRNEFRSEEKIDERFERDKSWESLLAF